MVHISLKLQNSTRCYLVLVAGSSEPEAGGEHHSICGFVETSQTVFIFRSQVAFLNCFNDANDLSLPLSADLVGADELVVMVKPAMSA
jgi:hypothetical protein